MLIMIVDPDLEHLRPSAREFVAAMGPTSLMPSLDTPEELQAIRGFEMPDEETVLPVTTRIVSHGDVTVPFRVFVPESPVAVYVDIHGGGFCLGSAKMHDAANARLAAAARVAVVSVDYRLAPEHPFPAGLDDCEAVCQWVLEHGDQEFGTARMLLGGESAGANLALASYLRMHRTLSEPTVLGLALIYGVFDLNGTPSQLQYTGSTVLSATDIKRSSERYLPGWSFEQRRDPYASPLYAELKDLPPALFLVGEDDPLLDDTLFMSARWRAAGGEAQLSVFPGSPHGFANFPGPLADVTEAMLADWITARLEQSR